MADYNDVDVSSDEDQRGSNGLATVTSTSENPDATPGLRSRRRRLTGKSEFAGQTEYVAVSYCWTRGDASIKEIRQSQTQEQFYSLTKDGWEPSRSPTDISERVVSHAGVKLLWIDQDSIEQDDLKDKERGVQSMDLVYVRPSHPVAILDNIIESESHLNALRTVVEKRDRASGGRLKDLETDEWQSLAEVLELIC